MTCSSPAIRPFIAHASGGLSLQRAALLLVLLSGSGWACAPSNDYLEPPPDSYTPVALQVALPGDSTAVVTGARVRPGFFPAIHGPAPRVLFTAKVQVRVGRVVPYLGRYFVEAEYGDRGTPVAVIGYDLWMARFHGDPRVIGKAIDVNGHAGVVVGVGPPGFRPPRAGEIWLPGAVRP